MPMALPPPPHCFGAVMIEYKKRPKNERSCRLGQWFMNNFDPQHSFNQLYYEKDNRKAHYEKDNRKALGMIQVLYYTGVKGLKEFIDRRFQGQRAWA